MGSTGYLFEHNTLRETAAEEAVIRIGVHGSDSQLFPSYLFVVKAENALDCYTVDWNYQRCFI